MRTYDRHGVHIEQCDSCRGVFLDYGELETLTQMESRWVQPAPPPAAYGHAAPAWGAPQHGHGHHGRSFAHMLFSS
jgi:hypothetical protein